MDPISKNQEYTLRNWVATFRRHPNELERAFLQADKGLSERQIDAFLEKEAMSQNPRFQSDNNDFTRGQFDLDNVNSSLMGVLPPLPQEAAAWSPIASSRNPFSELIQQEDLWSSMSCYDNGVVRNNAPSLDETKSLLADPVNPHWTYMSTSDRSSCVSSRTWGTSSTFSDVFSESGQLDYTRFSRASECQPLPLFATSNAIAEENESCHCPCVKHETENKELPLQPPAPKLSKPLPKLPPKTEKVPVKYICTVCHSSFARKGDWERHEDSQHDPQLYWTCMLGDAAIKTSSRRWECAFCDTVRPNQAEMAEHLLKQHKVNPCARRPIEGRTWTRKDKLKQHLQQVHGLTDTAERWKEWHRAPSKRKKAWGCGFCGACCSTWEDRLSHIAEHFETESLHPTQWSSTLVIKGLLKQMTPEFNVASSWKRLIGSSTNSERNLVWSQVNATMLKSKLEYQEGTAQELALEARRLAIKLDRVEPPRTAPYSNMGDMSATFSQAFGERIWPEAASLGDQPLPSTLSREVDIDMSETAAYI